MKATGITRPVDTLGRIVLPKELRDVLEIKENDRMEIFRDGDSIVLHKYEPCCIFCGEAGETLTFHGKQICRDCASAIGAEAQ